MTEEEIARRLPVWDELASLFLDTDYIGIVGPERMAARMRPSGFDAAEIEDMLFDEVLPAFAFNLRSVAGEWGFWSPNELRERMIAVQHWSRARRFLSGWGLRRYTRREWDKIRPFLD